MKIIAIILFIFLMGCTSKESINLSNKIIPKPDKIDLGIGTFLLNSEIIIISNSETNNEAQYLSSILKKAFKTEPQIISKGNDGIVLKLNKKVDNVLENEGYNLSVTSNNITIEAATPTGIFYGIQTLRQLLPPSFEYISDSKKSVSISNVNIIDKPAFSWRAFMLDEARYFKGMESVKELLDQMALLKMNIFHWHLVDDQGWRIEIKKYPKLTEIGSVRKGSHVGGYCGKGGWDGKEYTTEPHSGFYTQDEIKEIIEYASERHILVIPEIEMPGHCKAAIASYPWLGTTGEAIEVPIKFGAADGSYNIANPKVIQFLEDVLDEVIELFPGKIIHIGGDEVNFGQWKESKEIQDYMSKKGLKTPSDLQIYFTNQMSNYIASKRCRMMGWNDVLGGIHEWQDPADEVTIEKLSKSTIIHFWKGSIDLITQAASDGYDIVNAHWAYTYLDCSNDTTTIEKVYSFNPIPKDLDDKFHSKVLGLGGQIWGEWIPAQEDLERQVYPRIAAIAEVGWTEPENKNYENFQQSLGFLKKRWDFIGIKYFKNK